MDTKTFFRRLDRISDIPTLPVVATRVNKMLQDYDISINKLSETIEKDQAIVSKILRLVNSAFYGFQSKISSIPHAMVLLGFNTVRNAVISVSIIDALSGGGAIKEFDIKGFWGHSVAVAVTSRRLAEKTRLAVPDEAFVAGLLHDVGKVILVRYFSELFSKVLALIDKEGLSFYEAEKKLLPADHAQIGGHLAQKWQLPISLIETITYHHAIKENSSNLNLLMIVHVANIIANNFEAVSEGAPDFSMVYPEAAKIMAPQLETVTDWYPGVETEIESACEFFLEEN